MQRDFFSDVLRNGREEEGSLRQRRQATASVLDALGQMSLAARWEPKSKQSGGVAEDDLYICSGQEEESEGLGWHCGTGKAEATVLRVAAACRCIFVCCAWRRGFFVFSLYLLNKGLWRNGGYVFCFLGCGFLITLCLTSHVGICVNMRMISMM